MSNNAHTVQTKQTVPHNPIINDSATAIPALEQETLTVRSKTQHCICSTWCKCNIIQLSYFTVRYLVLITTMFICMISCLYAIGNLITLEATNFYCPSYTAEQVRQHNVENGYNQGDSSFSCWYIDKQKLNWQDVRSLKLNIYVAFFQVNNVFQLLQSVIYFLIVIFLFIVCLIHFCYLFYDTFYIVCFKWNQNKRILKTFEKLCYTLNLKNQQTKKNKQNNKKKKKKKCCISCICSCVGSLTKTYVTCVKCGLRFYYKNVKPYYYLDGKWRLLSIICKELLEIVIQLIALLFYGGINVFNSNDNILSQEPKILQGTLIVQCVLLGGV